MPQPFLPAVIRAIMVMMWWSRLFATAAAAGLVACSPGAASLARHTAVPPAPPVSPVTPRSSAQVDPPPSAAALADARHLLNRFAFGPRPGEVERLARSGVERWLEEQLAGPEESPLLEASLVSYRAALVPPEQLVDDWLGDGWESEMRTLKDLRQETKPYFREHLERLATAEVTRDILSQRQLEAVMSDFWVNHFNVYAAKGFVRLFEGDYLERAIRPHALGKFSDLLLATARHPAMLIYLDNADSRKERAGDAKGRKRMGLNENYARELLELHTLGLDAGYTQADVRDVARILTGWSVVRMERGQFDFAFVRKVHDRGEKTVLGRTFPAGEDEAEGVRLLAMLAEHPATAKHLARRLCARFVSDSPPESCVSAAAAAYTATDGDIKAVVRAIVKDPSFWAQSARGKKLKTPLELLASAARAVSARPDGSLGLARTLEELGAPLLQERVPTGYPDSEPEWASGGGMLARMSFASDLAEGRVRGLEVAWQEALPAHADTNELVSSWGAALLGVTPEARTLQLIRQEIAAIQDPDQRRAAAVALLLGSPEFQRQ
jgi:uncharacterized protein (DUF1800 family)